MVDLDLIGSRVSMDFEKRIARTWSDKSDSVRIPVERSCKFGNGIFFYCCTNCTAHSTHHNWKHFYQHC